MKKIMTILFVALVCGTLSFGEEDGTVVTISASEWNFVKNVVNTNGYCKIPRHDVALCVTNDVDRTFFPLHPFPPGPEMCPPDKKTEKSGKNIEPLPYY